MCKFSGCPLRIWLFEGRRCSAWQRHSWDICHAPAQFLSRLPKVGNGSKSTVRVTDWGLIEFYNFSSTYFESFRTTISWRLQTPVRERPCCVGTDDKCSFPSCSSPQMPRPRLNHRQAKLRQISTRHGLFLLFSEKGIFIQAGESLASFRKWNNSF